MKITKSQKEAIINEIIRRIREENQTIAENFDKNYKFTKEEKEFLDTCKEVEEINKRLKNLVTKCYELSCKFGHPISNCYDSIKAKRDILDCRLEDSDLLKSVCSSEIRDRLEIATINPSFDVEEFIKKFI